MLGVVTVISAFVIGLSTYRQQRDQLERANHIAAHNI